MTSGLLTLLVAPGGFDVFTQASELSPLEPAVAPLTVKGKRRIVLRRQPQFQGTAEILYEVDGVRLPAEETGDSTDERADWLSPDPTRQPPFRLTTVVRRL